MVKHVWSVLCMKSITDQKSNNISLIEVLERLTFEVSEDFLKQIKDKPPEQNVLLNQPFEIVSMWSRAETRGEAPVDVKVELIDPKGALTEAKNFRIVIPDGKLRLRVNLQLPGVPIKVGGVHSYRVSFKEDDAREYTKAADIPLEIVLNFPKPVAA